MNSDAYIAWSRTLGTVFLLAATAAAGIGVWQGMATRAFVGNAVAAVGTIVELRPDHSGDNTMYHAVFEFRDAAGTVHRKIPSWSSTPPAYDVGENVNVLYLPGEPSEARISHIMSLWLFPAVCAFATASNFIFGTFLLWFVPSVIRRKWPVPEVDPAA